MFHVEHQITYSNFTSFSEVLKLFDDYHTPLNNYIDQLLWWNNKVNLVSRDVSRETVREHIIHSLIPTHSKLFQQAEVIIDAGTGGGLPGLPLSIVNKDKKMVPNDIVTKKIMACKQMVFKLGMKNCELKSGSIGEVGFTGKELVVTKHAFKINDLINLLAGNEWDGIIMLKGLQEIESELEGIQNELSIHVISLEQDENSFYDGKALVEITRK
jgi:16S rRNA (guanine527-N7)-methyltransferase